MHSRSVPLVGELARRLVLRDVADLAVAELEHKVRDDAGSRLVLWCAYPDIDLNAGLRLELAEDLGCGDVST
jgi:hypothetical protein